MNIKTLTAALATAALLAACGTTKTTAPAAGAKPSTLTQAADGTLIGPDGRTLYVFAKDVAGSGKSTCVDACAANWPPLGVASTAQSIGEYTVMTRADGNKQWAYKGMPLYCFAKDAKPGDKLGQGVGGVWAVARP